METVVLDNEQKTGSNLEDWLHMAWLDLTVNEILYGTAG